MNTVSIPFKREGVLQDGGTSIIAGEDATVSIPFKREGVLQVWRYGSRGQWFHWSFNSLQTGRCIASLAITTSAIEIVKFQFPSNGKVYCKNFDSDNKAAVKWVSIPFKREGVLQVNCRDLAAESPQPVSIPFKREGVLQAILFMRLLYFVYRFNSLQTGRCIARFGLNDQGGF